MVILKFVDDCEMVLDYGTTIIHTSSVLFFDLQDGYFAILPQLILLCYSILSASVISTTDSVPSAVLLEG